MNNDINKIKIAVGNGIVATLGCCALTILYYIFGDLNYVMTALPAKIFILINISVFLIIGWGVYKQLWIAALCGVLIFLIERIILWWYQTSMPIVTVVTALLVVLFYVQSIRGILKWKKLKGRMGRTEGADENRHGIGGESPLQGKE